MNEYEILLDEIVNEIPVIETELKINTGLKGSYRNKTIFLDKYLNTVEKRIVLSEEYSHHKTSVGNIINYTNPENRKQEWKARRDSVERLVTLDQLIDCAKFGCHTKFECAEFLGVTEEFFEEVLIHYHNKYGTIYLYKNHIFIFDDYSIYCLNAKEPEFNIIKK
ncbi:TPA: ImmA/IrrE family metallo-endopeptidase [Enterococcus faecium]|uniref:ImmA/IrrE family metallo-endopeptidase n=1 Tax=Enterococcus faecium TaxID=1352 RepID=UPI0005EB9552|nr:ImmA/IrrE family metallo-endopeptidase [Enterococcus faecium]KNB95787.1 hypothetical protein LK34_01380 [Enterococcus faecium]